MDTRTIPEELRSDDLFLLVGTNPLPNWVAAKLLTNPGGCVHLVHTSGVKPYMERLKRILESDRESGLTVEYFSTSEADAANIFSDVSGEAKKLAKSGKKRVGLNYTGGTKMMSVHSHRALRHEFKDEAILSYLDARTLMLKFDSSGREIDVRSAPEARIDFETLLRLHDEYAAAAGRLHYEQKATCPMAARGLVQVYSNRAGQWAWTRWCGTLKVELRKLRDSRIFEREVARLDEIQLPTQTEISESVESFLRTSSKSYSESARKKILGQVGKGYEVLLNGLRVKGGDTLHTVVQRNNEFHDSIGLARWLHGTWLEHYTFQQLESCRAPAGINPNGLALNFYLENKDEREFEADVLALRGYQLFYISCYSGDDFQRAKEKLFEAMLRASQLGGDEAKFALVCCVEGLEGKDDVRRQVAANWQKGDQVEVFGRNSLPNLADSLKEWFIGKR